METALTPLNTTGKTSHIDALQSYQDWKDTAEAQAALAVLTIKNAPAQDQDDAKTCDMSETSNRTETDETSSSEFIPENVDSDASAQDSDSSSQDENSDEYSYDTDHLGPENNDGDVDLEDASQIPPAVAKIPNEESGTESDPMEESNDSDKDISGLKVAAREFKRRNYFEDMDGGML